MSNQRERLETYINRFLQVGLEKTMDAETLRREDPRLARRLDREAGIDIHIADDLRKDPPQENTHKP
jgi:hypothetical protein